MSARVVKFSTSELKLGLYVSALDRPWLGTPFPFQGFMIRDQAQLDELKRLCGHVFVDLFKSEEVAEAERITTVVDARRRDLTVPEADRITVRRELTGRSASAPRPATPSYQVSRSVEEEVGAAEQVHAEAMHAARSMIVRLLDEGRLDADLAREAVGPMMASVMRNPDALIWLTRLKDHGAYGYQHAVACAVWGLAFARHLGFDQGAIYEVGLGCLLFDVGNTRVPQAMFTRSRTLTPTEWKVMHAHVEHGLEILSEVRGVTPRVLEMVHCHHERFDGSGYPRGLSGDRIPAFAKIAGMVDSYDALLSPRPHAPSVTPHEARRAIYRWRGTLFQPEVVERFIQVIGAFPVGSLVELNTGAVGAVIAQNQALRLRPRLMLVLDNAKHALPRPHIVDLAEDEPWHDAQSFWIDKHLAPGAYGIDPRQLHL